MNVHWKISSQAMGLNETNVQNRFLHNLKSDNAKGAYKKINQANTDAHNASFLSCIYAPAQHTLGATSFKKSSLPAFKVEKPEDKQTTDNPDTSFPVSSDRFNPVHLGTEEASTNCSSTEDSTLPELDSYSGSSESFPLPQQSLRIKKKTGSRSARLSKSSHCGNLAYWTQMKQNRAQIQQEQIVGQMSRVNERLKDLYELQGTMATDMRGLRSEMANIGLVLGKMLAVLEKSAGTNLDSPAAGNTAPEAIG
ncbi:hypothetical protein FKM82_023146 [Ascaphus truei]